MTQGPLPLILLSARDHPNKEFREKLWLNLEIWLQEKIPIFCEIDAQKLIKSHKGTFLEPFYLSSSDMKLASFLLRLALSKEVNASRFRVVSSVTIGNQGGAVFTRSGKSFYSERFAFGDNPLHNSQTKFFAPSMKVSAPTRTSSGKLRSAQMEVTEEGLFIFLHRNSFNQLDWVSDETEAQFKKLARDLNENSVLGEKDIALSQLGLSVEATEDGICVASKSPESLIRLSAYIVQGGRITLRGVGRYEFVIQMPKTGVGNANCMVVAQDSFAIDWMDITGFGAPKLEINDITKISKWAMPHAEWVSQITEERA
tara:strand:+ start:4499 stop:5440 length:942 start_codon:yes stop_codon:yes gene_type:complete